MADDNDDGGDSGSCSDRAIDQDEANDRLWRALNRSVEDPGAVEVALASGADPNLKRGQTALGVACRNNDLAAIEALLEAGANPNLVGRCVVIGGLTHAMHHQRQIPSLLFPTLHSHNMFIFLHADAAKRGSHLRVRAV